MLAAEKPKWHEGEEYEARWLPAIKKNSFTMPSATPMKRRGTVSNFHLVFGIVEHENSTRNIEL